MEDLELVEIKSKLSDGKNMERWQMSDNGGLCYMSRLCVTSDPQLIEEIFNLVRH